MPSSTKDLALCLSGGGFRATYFHLGVIRYLRESGLLGRVGLVNAVSGGSVLAAHLALNWERYTGDEASFNGAVRELTALGRYDLRGRIVRRIPLGVVLPAFRRTALLKRYLGRLVRHASLGDIAPGTQDPAGRPTFHFLATSMTSGNLCFFSSDGFSIDDGTSVKTFPRESLPLATAMAASAAFPPLFPPLQLSRSELNASVQEFPYECEYLTDGGVFDNIGIRHAFRATGDYPEIATVISSDASGAFDWDTAATFSVVVPRTIRTTDILMKRVAELEDEHVKLRAAQSPFHVVSVDIADVIDRKVDPKALPTSVQRALKNLRTDFDRFSSGEVECLRRHGYTVAKKALAVVQQPSDQPRSDVTSDDAPGAAERMLPAIERGRMRRWSPWNARDVMSWVLLVVCAVGLGGPVWAYYRAQEELATANVALERSSADLSLATQRLGESRASEASSQEQLRQLIRRFNAEESEQSKVLREYSQSRFWKYTSPRVEVPQTGVSATEQAPRCGDQRAGVRADEVVARIGAGAIDNYLEKASAVPVGGYGVSGVLAAMAASDGDSQWLKDRLGIGGGLSSCATQCVMYPIAEAPRLSIFGCLSETGGDGLDCGADGWEQGQWMGAYNLSHASTEKATVSCMTAKNWSHNRNRWFWVVATDVNALSGAPLPQVYR